MGLQDRLDPPLQLDGASRAGYRWPEKFGPRLVEKSRENWSSASHQCPRGDGRHGCQRGFGPRCRRRVLRPAGFHRSYRQRLFVEHYFGESSGSAVDAARRAGYQWSEKLGPRLVEKRKKPVPEGPCADDDLTASHCGLSGTGFFLFSPPAAAQPLTILSCSEALKATRSRRACRMDIRRNDRPCMFDSPKQLRMVSLELPCPRNSRTVAPWRAVC